MINYYDKLFTIDSRSFETEFRPEDFKGILESKFGLKKRSFNDLFSFGRSLKYSGELTDESFKVVQGNPDDPSFFFFTRIVGKYSKCQSGTRIEIKAQFGDVFYYGLPPCLIIWLSMAVFHSWTILLFAALFIAFIGMYGKIKIQNDFDKFQSDLHFHTETRTIESMLTEKT